LNGEVEDYPVHVENIVLPLTMVSFDAKAVSQQSVLLNWKAVNDLEFAGFEIQRSTNGTTWNTIGYVPAVVTNSVHAYQFTDVNALKGKVQYRLHIVHKNGNNRYSDIKSVTIKEAELFVTLTPNPASSKVTITLNAGRGTGLAQVRVVDASGKEMYAGKVQTREGNTDVEIPNTGNWPTGNYLVIVSTNQFSQTQKLLIKR